MALAAGPWGYGTARGIPKPPGWTGGGGGGGGGVPQVGAGAPQSGAGGSGPTSTGGGSSMGGTGGGGMGGGGSTTQLNMPQAQGYDPFGGNPELSRNLTDLGNYGKGLMDPDSDYYKKLSEAMQQQIGGQSQAQQRAAALRGAWGGMGAGQGGEVMQTQADIAQSGFEAQGMAEGGLALRAPMAGAQMLGQTFNPMLGIDQLKEGSRQFGANLGEGARQFGANLGFQQQQMAQNQGQFQSNQQFQADQANQAAYLRELSMQYGAF